MVEYKKETINTEIKINTGYDELNALINHQNIMSQKVSILTAINVVIISIIVGLTIPHDLLGLITIIPFCISLCINVYILVPKAPKTIENGYYFKNYDLLKKDHKKILDIITEEDNLEKQLQTNAKILRQKYRRFAWSLFCSFFVLYIVFYCFLPLYWLFLFIIDKIKGKNIYKKFLNKIKKTWLHKFLLKTSLWIKAINKKYKK